MTLGEQIHQLRTARGLSQGDVADALDVSRQSVSKWETDSSVPELEKLLGLSELFGVTLDTLVRGGESGQSAAPEAPQTDAAAAPPAQTHSTRKISLYWHFSQCFDVYVAVELSDEGQQSEGKGQLLFC